MEAVKGNFFMLRRLTRRSQGKGCEFNEWILVNDLYFQR